MATILSLLDVLVLLLLIVYLVRMVHQESSGSGSPLLALFAALFVTLLAVISLGAYIGLVTESSMLMQVIFLVILVAMAAVILSTWKAKPVA